MKKIQYLFVFALFYIFISCKNENKNIIEKWDDGTEKKVRIFDKNFEYETNYHKNGKVESEGIIVDEKKEKDWLYYYSDGTKRQRIVYREGKPFGEAIYFYPSGNKEKKTEYDEVGKAIGAWTTYSEKGDLISTGNYLHGRKIGIWKYFNENEDLERKEKMDDSGRVEWIKNFNEKEEEVRYSEFNQSEELKIESYQIDSSSKKTFYRFAFNNGQIEREGERLNSKEVGLWTFWYSNGNKKAQGKFHENLFIKNKLDVIPINIGIDSLLPHPILTKGLKIGKWTYWNEKGKKIAVINSKIKEDKIIENVIFVSPLLFK